MFQIIFESRGETESMTEKGTIMCLIWDVMEHSCWMLQIPGIIWLGGLERRWIPGRAHPQEGKGEKEIVNDQNGK